MYVPGDKYTVFRSVYGSTEARGMFDSWQEAKALRNEIFYQNLSVRACWVMKHNPSQGTVPNLYGSSLKRTKHEVR
jgi:hypothetical protein